MEYWNPTEHFLVESTRVRVAIAENPQPLNEFAVNAIG